MEAPDGGCCANIHSSRDPLPYECDPMVDPDCGAADGGGVTPVGTVSVTFVNALAVQATFYADGGGAQALAAYHQTIWLPAGQRQTVPNAMSGTVGSTLTMSTMLAAEGFPHYTLSGGVFLSKASMACTVTATMHPDGYAYLTSACS
jgi:hypothetical protein